MRLRRLSAHFGRLAGQVTFLPDRLNLVLDGNEQGKSTLVAAILAALYGFPQARGRTPGGRLRERDRYRPLHGDRFEVTLELEVDGHRYEVHRDFRQETAVVRDALTGADVTARFLLGKDRYDVGRVLLGLTREQFLKTALVRQGEAGQIQNPGDSTGKLEAAVSTHGGDRTAADAIAALQRALTSYEGVTLKHPGMVDSEITRLEQALREIDGELTQLDAQRREVDKTLAGLEGLEREVRALEEERGRAHYLATLAALEECRDRLRRHQEALRAVEELRERAAALRPAEAVRRDDYDRLVQLQAAADHARRELDRLERRRREAEEAWARAESGLRAYDGFRGFTDEDLAEAHRLRQAVDDALSRLHAAREAAARAGEDAARRGVDPGRAEDLEARFGGLSPADREVAARYAAHRHELEREMAGLMQDIAALEGGARSRSAGRRTLGAGAALAAAGIVLSAVLLPAGLPVLAAGVMLLVYALWRGRSGGGRKAVERHAALLVKRRDLEAAARRLREHEERGAALARALGYRDAGDLSADYAAYLETRAELAAVRQLQAAAEEAARHAESRRQEAAALWRRAGRAVPAERVEAASLDDLIAALRAYLDLRAERRRWEAEAEELRAREDEQRRSLAQALAAAREISSRYGLPEEPEAALAALGGLLRQQEELDRVRSERIPARERDLLPEDRLVEAQDQARSLEAELAGMRSRRPFLESLRAEAPASSYHARLRELDAQMDDARSRREALVRTAGGLLDRYKERYPALLEQREELERALRRARAFRAAVTLARDTLERIAAESHQDWAQALNAEAARVLPALSGRYVDLRFHRDLSFTVRDREGRVWDHRAVEDQLSAGARDQIYLAVRAILARCFSRGGAAVPLILDDPFVTSDDHRFQAAMRFLAQEIAPVHQVIVTSCHEARHRDLLLAANPDLAGRIHVIEMDGLLAAP